MQLFVTAKHATFRKSGATGTFPKNQERKMQTEFDEKGKIFTEVVKKRPVDVHIQTPTHLIKGRYHVRLGERIMDELDRGGLFIAVTDAGIYDSTGKLIEECEFLTVNRRNIVWLLEDDKSTDAGEKS
jgi:hypothetical protein